MGEHAQFNLRVVYSKNYVVLILRNKRSSNLFAEVASNGNILQVRIAARKAARCRAPLNKASVDALCIRIHQCREHRDIGALHFLEFAVFNDGENNRMRSLVTELFENDCVGAAFLYFGESERVKKLLGRANVEFDTRHVADFFLKIFDAALQFLFQFLKGRNIYRDPHRFHLVQYLQQRHFLREEILHVVELFEFLLERLPKAAYRPQLRRRIRWLP